MRTMDWVGLAGLLLAGVPAAAKAQAVDELVVTANRTGARLQDVPSSIEVVTAEQLENTVSVSFMDGLKKNAGVDVIQYPNGLAGVSLRGLRPDFEFSINPRTLTLVDGRPSGSTSFTTIAPESIERVEVLKGPASSFYGASAIGGVVNIITKRSTGPLAGRVGVGYGAFETWRAELSAGGSLGERADFDLGLGYFDQGEDFKTGSGARRPNSDYDRLSGRLRLGAQVTEALRVDASVDGAKLRNNVAGPLSFDPQTPNATDLERFGGDLRLSLDAQDHQLRFTAYASHDSYDFVTIPTTGPRYRSSRTQSDYRGLQLQDTWALRPVLSLTYGLDWSYVEVERFASGAGGAPRAPFSPNESRETRALFAEVVYRAFDERLILTAGGRQDWIAAETLPTPLLTSLRPGETKFEVFNPRGGVVFKLTDAWRIHATAGQGFAPPQANQIAGQSEEFAGAQQRLTNGNPDLKPESNTTYDIGVGYDSARLHADLTYFDSETKDRITTVVETNTPTLRVTTYVNANASKMRGLEAVVGVDAGALFGIAPRRFTVASSLTHLIDSEEIVGTTTTPVRNVADWKGVVSATISNGSALSATISARHNGERWDADNSQGFIYTGGRGGTFVYDTFTVFDLSARWQVTPRDLVRLEISNLFDKDYYEKGDYPMPGRAANVRFARSF